MRLRLIAATLLPKDTPPHTPALRKHVAVYDKIMSIIYFLNNSASKKEVNVAVIAWLSLLLLLCTAEWSFSYVHPMHKLTDNTKTNQHTQKTLNWSFILLNISFIVYYFRVGCQGYLEVTFPSLIVILLSLQMSVEVERKFFFHPDTLRTLEKIGGKTCLSSLHH